jgi:hypothetical protein
MAGRAWFIDPLSFRDVTAEFKRAFATGGERPPDLDRAPTHPLKIAGVDGTSRNCREGGGGDGIRTHDTALGPYNGLANRRLQPLGHPSARRATKFHGVCWQRF